jgi:hypothetical protein
MKTINFKEKNYLVLSRKKGKPTEKCPFCNKGHVHGLGDGHRIAHCATGYKETVIVGNKMVYQKDGYFIETI